MKPLILTKGNFGSIIRPVIKDQDGVIIDLTGKTIGASIVKPDNTKQEVVFQVADAPNGISQYQLTANDTDVVGTYMVYITVSNGSINITSNDILVYTVVDEDGGV